MVLILVCTKIRHYLTFVHHACIVYWDNVSPVIWYPTCRKCHTLTLIRIYCLPWDTNWKRCMCLQSWSWIWGAYPSAMSCSFFYITQGFGFDDLRVFPEIDIPTCCSCSFWNFFRLQVLDWQMNFKKYISGYRGVEISQLFSLDVDASPIEWYLLVWS